MDGDGEKLERDNKQQGQKRLTRHQAQPGGRDKRQEQGSFAFCVLQFSKEKNIKQQSVCVVVI